MAIPGITPEIADGIISFRQDKEITSPQEVGILQESTPYVSTAESSTFTIEAAGYKGSEKGGYAIRATVTITGNDSYKYVYYKSPIGINQ